MSTSNNHRNALPIGYRLHNYLINNVFCENSFTITYLAQDTQLNHQVVIKEYFPIQLATRQAKQEVHPQSVIDSENFHFGLEQFIGEGRALTQLKHPNVVDILKVFQSHHTAYWVMVYEQGQSLAEIFKKGKILSQDKLMKIFTPLLSGLKAAHKLGLLHLNIKPSNIYLRDNDQSPILLDFGTARYALGNRCRNLSMMVTPGYAAFEQYEGGNNQGPWTDIYSLGAVLYHAISGHLPVEAPERAKAIKLQKQPDPLRSALQVTPKHYSKSFLQAIDWALKVSEKERPQLLQWRTMFIKSKLFNRQFLFNQPFFRFPKIPKPVMRVTLTVLTLVLIAVGIASSYLFSIKKYLADLHQQNSLRIEHIENEKKRAREHFLTLLQTQAYSSPILFEPLSPPSQEIRSLQSHEAGICVEGCLAFSPDGQWLASGSWDHSIKLWEVSTGKMLITLKGLEDLILSIAFSPNGLLLASGSADNTVKLWEVSTGQLLASLKEEGIWVSAIAFSPEGQMLAIEGPNHTIKLRHLKTGKTLHSLTGHKNIINSLVFHPDGHLFATASADGTIKLWEVETGHLLKTLKGHQRDVLSLAFSPDGMILISGDAASRIKVWDVKNGQLLKTLKEHTNWVLSVTFSPDGRTFASGSHDHTIKLWDIEQGKVIRTLKGHKNDVNSIAFSPNGNLFASGSRDKTIKLWQ